jgi:histidine phosphotransferase ChpT
MMAAPARAAASVSSAAAPAKSKPAVRRSAACAVVCLGPDKAECFLRLLIRVAPPRSRLEAERGHHVTEIQVPATSSLLRGAEAKEKAMTEPTALGDLELAALVSSRICHDIINPVAAISNGLEMLAEEPDESMREAAMDLIRKSAAQASAKLQFARLAFGAAGSSGAEIDLRDAEKVAREFVGGSGKHQVAWQGPAATLPKNKVKLLLNLVALGAIALPRGGTVSVEVTGTPPNVSFTVRAKGDSARLADQIKSLLTGTNGVAVDAHSIQPYYTRRVAAAAGMTVTAEARDGEVEFRAA